MSMEMRPTLWYPISNNKCIARKVELVVKEKVIRRVSEGNCFNARIAESCEWTARSDARNYETYDHRYDAGSITRICNVNPRPQDSGTSKGRLLCPYNWAHMPSSIRTTKTKLHWNTNDKVLNNGHTVYTLPTHLDFYT